MSASIRFENYELLRQADGAPLELGRGAMGVTYKARDLDLHCDVALKVISPGILGNPEVRERFQREARAAAQLRHANIATVFRLGVTGDGTHYYAMEFCDGQTLQQALAAWGPLPAATAIHLAWQVAKALRVAEQHRVVHRDLKPANLIVMDTPDEGLFIKVIDFGLAKSFADGGTTLASSGAGFAGTAHYASPEQIDERDLDIRSDIYSLGACLWFMLTGHPPFEGSVARVMSQTLSAEPPWEKLAGLPPGVLALLRRMLAKNRDDRHATAAALRAELQACLENLSTETAADETPTIRAPAAATKAEKATVRSAPGEQPGRESLERRPAAAAPRPAAEFPTSMPPPAPPTLPLPPAPDRRAFFAAGAALLVLLGLAWHFGMSAPRERAGEERRAAAEREESARERERTRLAAEAAAAPAAPAAATPPPATSPPPAATPAPPAVGRILVNTIPPGATLLLDNRMIGRTPLRLEEVPEGIRRLTVQQDGYEAAELIVEVNPGATTDPGTIHLIPVKSMPVPPPPAPKPFAPALKQPPGLSDDDVRNVIVQNLNATASGDLAALVACYASPVDYFDEGRKTSGTLRRDLESYRRLWPHYQIGDLSQIRIGETGDPHEKTASYSYVFVARNLQNGKQSRGLAHDEVRVRLINGRALITRCRQDVTDRQKNF